MLRQNGKGGQAMKWMIASDIHGSGYYCAAMLDAFEGEAADRLLLLGDLLYHGPRNALPRDYDPGTVAERLNAVGDRLLCVRGNCDAEVDQMVLDFPVLTEHRVLELCGRRFLLTHGHHVNIDSLPDQALSQGAKYLLYGHTHIPLNR